MNQFRYFSKPTEMQAGIVSICFQYNMNNTMKECLIPPYTQFTCKKTYWTGQGEANAKHLSNSLTDFFINTCISWSISGKVQKN